MMTTRYWFLLLLLAAAILAEGCATQQPAPQQPRTPSEWIALPRPQ